MKVRLTALILIFLLLAACSPSAEEAASPASSSEAAFSPASEPPETMTLPYFPEAGLNPYTCDNEANQVLFPLLWDGLFELDDSFAPIEVLCDGYTMSRDRLEYTLHLNKDAKFTDASRLTADDVIYSLEAAMAPGSQYEARLSQVAEVRGTSEDTVIITLHAPNGNLPALLDIPIVKADSLDVDLPGMGTGAYQWTEENGQIMLLARDNWWRQSSFEKETVILYPLSSARQLTAAFAAYEIDFLKTDFSQGDHPLFQDCDIWEYPTSNLLYVGCNIAQGPMQDLALRQALQTCISQSTIVATAFSRHGKGTALPISPSAWYYDAALDQALMEGQDTALALEQAGYDSAVPTLTFLVCSDNPSKVLAAEQIVSAMQQGGVSVLLEQLPWEEYQLALEMGAFDLYLAEVCLTADFDLSPLLSSEGALNYGGFASPKADALLAAYKAAAQRTRGDAASALCTYIAQEAPIFPICFFNHAAVTRKDTLPSLSPTYHNLFFTQEGE